MPRVRRIARISRRPRLPTGAEMLFVRAMHERVDMLRAFADERIIGQWGQNAKVHGPRHHSYRGDANRSPWIEDRLREAAGRLERESARPQVQLVAERVVTFSGAEHKRLVPIQLRGSPDIGPLLDGFRENSLARIRSFDADQIDELRDILEEAEREGWRTGDLSQRIGERLDVSESRADTIARTQTLQFNAQITRERQTSSGIARFVWSTSGDERVRDSHEDIDGEEFSWDDLPEVDGERVMPGEPVNCRCVAIPVLPEIVDEDEAEIAIAAE